MKESTLKELGENQLAEAEGEAGPGLEMASGDPRPEAIGDYMPHEIEASNLEHRAELLTSSDSTEILPKKEGGELEGDAPTQAELATTDH